MNLSGSSPYYINISGTDPEKLENSINHIMQTARAAAIWGLPGSRAYGFGNGHDAKGHNGYIQRTIHRVLAQMDGENLRDVHICPETMGKINQMGTIEEVLELCPRWSGLSPQLTLDI